MTLNTFLTAIADSIREKKQTTDKIKAIDFPTEISTIQAGTGASSLKLYTPSISLDNAQGVLTITDTANGAFVDAYELYINDELISEVTSKTLNLSNYIKNGGVYTFKVLAKGEGLESSDFSNIVTFAISDTNDGTPGLSYSTNKYGATHTWYSILAGIGTASESDIIVADYFEELPVQQVSSEAFKGNTFITSVICCDTIKKIINSAFKDCTSLKSITMGINTQIEADVFSGCTALKRIDYSKSNSVARCDWHGLNNIPSDVQIKVPANLIDEWKTATNWSEHAEKFVTEFTNTL